MYGTQVLQHWMKVNKSCERLLLDFKRLRPSRKTNNYILRIIKTSSSNSLADITPCSPHKELPGPVELRTM